jgi:ketosteroid isomerase-like protein
MSTDIANRTQAVLDHHLHAFLAKDISSILDDYTEESILVVNTAPEPIKGLAAIRAGFSQIFAAFTPEMISAMTVTRQTISGDVAYILWSAGESIPFASDTFVVHDGKIVAQTAVVQMGQAG